MDERIGTTKPLRWPKLTIQGRPYERGVGSQAGIGGGRFVVLPVGYVDTDGLLEALRVGGNETVRLIPTERIAAVDVTPLPAEDEPSEDTPPARRRRRGESEGDNA